MHLSAFDPSWTQLFTRERDRLAEALRLPPEAFEHIGSTAIPELTAKPIIDIQLGLEAFPPEGSLIARAERAGYHCFGEAGVAGRIYFTRRGTLAVNLHMVERGGEHWRNNLALREYLKRSPEARARYATAKRAALDQSSSGLLRYSEAKAGFVALLWEEARTQ
ncbi:MAG: GrpB family protein [Candidatus Eisenbacteria bacterium]